MRGPGDCMCRVHLLAKPSAPGGAGTHGASQLSVGVQIGFAALKLSFHSATSVTQGVCAIAAQPTQPAPQQIMRAALAVHQKAPVSAGAGKKSRAWHNSHARAETKHTDATNTRTVKAAWRCSSRQAQAGFVKHARVAKQNTGRRNNGRMHSQGSRREGPLLPGCPPPIGGAHWCTGGAGGTQEVTVAYGTLVAHAAPQSLQCPTTPPPPELQAPQV